MLLGHKRLTRTELKQVATGIMVNAFVLILALELQLR